MADDDDKPCILLVEDYDDTRESLSMLLELCGYRVVEARDGEEGLAELRAGLMPCLILLDLMMPVKDGWEFRIEQLANPALRSIPTVVMSALDAREKMHGLAGTLPKPVDLDKLFGLADRYCSGDT